MRTILDSHFHLLLTIGGSPPLGIFGKVVMLSKSAQPTLSISRSIALAYPNGFTGPK
jgi:hypothetical protein